MLSMKAVPVAVLGLVAALGACERKAAPPAKAPASAAAQTAVTPPPMARPLTFDQPTRRPRSSCACRPRSPTIPPCTPCSMTARQPA
jgi:hypothetical protein